MGKNEEIALELAKALIQNRNVVPVSGISNGSSNSIVFVIGETNYTFYEIVDYFFENLETIEQYL